MVAGTRALRIDETFLGGRVLPPPPTRHALFAVAIALSVLIHFGTIGIGDLFSETEGQYAAAAREMVQTGSYFLPTNDTVPRLQKPPLLYWLIIASYRLFGISAAATRVPIALAIVVTTALTFTIGERLSDYWRGFIAALVYVTSAGTFLLARIVMPEPLFGAFVAGAIYCGLAGFQQRRRRRLWFAGVWTCAALACLSKGPHGLLIPAVTFAILAISYREARMRFRALLWWPYVVLFIALVLPWYFWIEIHVNGSFHDLVASEWARHLLGLSPNGERYDDVPRLQFAANHLAWWFPWSLAILPALVFSWRRVIRPREMNFNDALPIAWGAAVFVPVLLIGQRQDYYALSMFSAFALWAAMIFDRTSHILRKAGALIIGTVGALLAIITWALPRLIPVADRPWGETDFRWTAWKAVADVPASTWLQFRPLLGITASALILGSLLTVYLLRIGREKISAGGLAIGMVAAGFCMINGVAQIAPYFSLADIARLLNTRLSGDGEVIFEGSSSIASSLGFYLERKFVLVNQEPDRRLSLTPGQRKLFLTEDGALERWSASHAVFLIVEQDRVGRWRELLMKRFHVYHQIGGSGTYVVLSNQL